MVLVHAAGGADPPVERRGIERHDLPILGPAHQVGDQAVRVQLRVAGPRGPVDEPGDHQPVGRDPRPHAVLLPAGPGRVPLQELHPGLDRLPMCGGDGVGGGIVTERPQQRHRLGRREGQVPGLHRSLPHPGHERLAGVRVAAVYQAGKVVGLDHAFEPEAAGPGPGPDARRLPDPEVVLLDPERHRVRQVLRRCQPGDRQHWPTSAT